MTNGRIRTTYSLPRTGISYVTETKHQNINNHRNIKLYIARLILTIIIFVIFFRLCKNVFNNVKINDQTYVVAGNDYKEYIGKTIKDVVVNYSNNYISSIASHYPYMKIRIEYKDYVDENLFDETNRKMAIDISNKLKQKKYKSNKFGYEYNIITLTFVTKKIDCKDIICYLNDNIQIYVLEIKNYDTLDEYMLYVHNK